MDGRETGRMYVVTSILKSADVQPYKLENVTSSRRLSPLITESTTQTPPPHATILSLDSEDLIVRLDIPERRAPKLVLFDMDSTLINEECIDLLATHTKSLSSSSSTSPGAASSASEEVARITREAMNGKLDFEASLRARVALLRGLPLSTLETVRSTQLTLAAGALPLCRALRKLGVRTGIASGGFTYFVDSLVRTLDLQFGYANTLHVDETTQTLSGTLAPSSLIVDARRKACILTDQMALLATDSESDQIDSDNTDHTDHTTESRRAATVAVGDGANDLPMLHEAGLGLAVHAKESVARSAPARLRFGDLTTLLYLFGYDAEQVKDLTRP